MAQLLFFVLSPNTVLSLIGIIHGPDKIVPTPAENWEEATVDVVIPAHNEEETIALTLASLLQQTKKPQRIILIDDASTDNTVPYVKTFCKENDLELILINRKDAIGKTPTLKRQAREFDGDVEFILDGDTVLESPNYIERTVQELYQGVGIASACGVILPFKEKTEKKWAEAPSVKKFLKKEPNPPFVQKRKGWARFKAGLSSLYRDCLYLFLQRFIYIGQMAYFGSITNPIGCAVAYRRKYVKDLFDKYEPVLGDDLTNSEDIFIGFANIHRGYRNIQVRDVTASTREPQADRLPKQIYMWSSSFFQSAYYFSSLVKSPFKTFKRRRAEKRAQKLHGKEIAEKRKIKEAYRQAFGEELTRKYGRPMGWVILMSLIEKTVYPLVIILMIIMGWWFPLGLTLGLETCVFLMGLVIAAKGQRIEYFFKGLLITPIRYIAVISDFFTCLHFAFERWILRIKRWRK